MRNVAIEKKTIEITGDWSEKTALEVFAPRAVNSITFNGKKIQTRKTLYGSLIGTLKASTHSVDSVKSSLPALTSWKVNDGLPERKADYDDSKWTGELLNHLTYVENANILRCGPYNYPKPDRPRNISSSLLGRIW